MNDCVPIDVDNPYKSLILEAQDIAMSNPPAPIYIYHFNQTVKFLFRGI